VPKTTKTNLNNYINGIQLSSLTRTVRDAVTVCKGLQIEDLSVDALRIVQDDEQDWLRESAQMRYIYSNSYFTIAADEPASCNLGFFGDQGYGKADWQRSFYVNLGQNHNGEITAKMLCDQTLRHILSHSLFRKIGEI